MQTKFKNLCLSLILVGVVSSSSFAKVIVFSAASMTNVLEEIKQEYLKEYPKGEVYFSFASSSVLARQIQQGAPADIFISANQKWMDYLAEHQVIVSDTRKDFIANKLVMIALKESPITQLDLAKTDWLTYLDNRYLAVGDPDHVPAGIYTKSAFKHFNYWKNIETKLARANNVRGALALVERGESPLGVVYETDAKASEKVKIVATFAENSHPKITYPIAVLKSGVDPEVNIFYHYLQSEKATQLLKKTGFSK